MTDPSHIAEARKKVSRPQVREAFLRNGAVIPADRDDLPDYVYESVFELLDSVIQQAGPAIQYVGPATQHAGPAVQGEPVAWSGWGCQYPGKMPRLYGERRIAELNCDWENGDQVLHFTAAPQPVEQQPDVAGLVWALKQILGWRELRSGREFPIERIEDIARTALAAHRKGGDHGR